MGGGVVHPGPPEKDFAMRGNTVEKGAVLGGAFGHAARDKTPEIVVVSGHANLAGFVGGTKGFLVQEQGFFPKCAFRGENTNGKGRAGPQMWESFGNVGLERCFLLGAWSGEASPPKPRVCLSTTRSMSSEKRSMSFHALESEVPPLNVRCGPIPGRVKSSRRIQQTQKSFSTLAACRRIRSSTWMHASRRSVEDILRKPSMVQGALAASRRRVSATQAGAYLRSFSNCAFSASFSCRRRMASTLSST